MFTRRYANFWDGLFRSTKTHMLGSGEVKTLTNLVSNGNFVNATGWDGIQGSVSVANNTGTSTLSGASSATGGLRHATDVAPIVGHKYGLTIRVRVTNSDCVLLRYFVGSTTGQVVAQPPVINQWYPKTIIATGDSTQQNVLLYHTYASAATAAGKVMEVQYVSCVDLTAAFGAGNEPSQTDYSNWISTQSNSWFDATATYIANTNQWF